MGTRSLPYFNPKRCKTYTAWSPLVSQNINNFTLNDLRNFNLRKLLFTENSRVKTFRVKRKFKSTSSPNPMIDGDLREIMVIKLG